MMSGEKESLQRIWDSLYTYKFKYRPIDVSILLKGEFLDILNLQKTQFVNGKSSSLFKDEEEWYKFAADVIGCVECESYATFIKKYLKGSNFKTKPLRKKKTYGLKWWTDSGAIGDTFFTKPGAVIVKDVQHYWIFALFSRDSFNEQIFKSEINGLEELAKNLET